METETKIQRALNVIEKRPGIRTDDLARAIGADPAKIAPLIYAATSNGFVVMCKVERPGKLPTNEYRLSSSVVASDWDAYRTNHTAERTKARKADPYRRETGMAPEEKRAVETVVEQHNKTAELENRIEGMNEQIADLQVALDVAQQTIHRMELEATQAAGADAITVTEAAIGYLVRVPKRKPRLCIKPERAVEAAKAAAKAAGRADVLALVPVGTARRKVATSVAWSEN